MPSSGDFSLQRIGELLNETIGVVAVRFAQGNFGEYAVITLDTGEQIRSGNQVILDQLKAMQKHLDGDTLIIARKGMIDHESKPFDAAVYPTVRLSVPVATALTIDGMDGNARIGECIRRQFQQRFIDRHRFGSTFYL